MLWWLRLIGIGGRSFDRINGNHWQREQFAGASDVLGTFAAGEQAIVADAVEACGQHVHEEAADELVRGGRHHLETLAAPPPGVFPLEGTAASDTRRTLADRSARHACRRTAAHRPHKRRGACAGTSRGTRLTALPLPGRSVVDMRPSADRRARTRRRALSCARAGGGSLPSPRCGGRTRCRCERRDAWDPLLW